MLNNGGNLQNNSSVGNGGSVNQGSGGIGTCYTDAAGIYLGAASYNMVNACDLTVNTTCGVQLGSPYATTDNTLNDNMITHCTINGAINCVTIPTTNGIFSFTSTGTNIIQSNIVKDCSMGLQAATNTNDIFALNNLFNNVTPLGSNILQQGENIIMPATAAVISSPGVYVLYGNLLSAAINTSDVTLDLNGYTISYGVTLTPNASSVIVKNGAIGPNAGTFSADGLYTSNCQNCIFQDLVISNCNNGIYTSSCQNCIFQDLQVSNCNNGIQMVGTSSTTISNNTLINCNCSYNTNNGILLNNIAGLTLQNCNCSYNLTGSYNNNNQTVQNVALTGAGIWMNNSQYNLIDGCICTNNATNCFSNNYGVLGTTTMGGLAGVMNCTVTGGGIYLANCSYNSIKNCICNNNTANLMSFNTGGGNFCIFPIPCIPPCFCTFYQYGGGAGIGGSGGGLSEPGANGICSIAGAAIFLDNISANNNIENCECNNNNSDNMEYNLGGNGGTASDGEYGGGGGAGIGGGGGGNANGGTGLCSYKWCGHLCWQYRQHYQ